MQIILALSDRKATFLSSPSWMTKPWIGRNKSSVDTALDILCKLPSLLQEWDIISAGKRYPETHDRVQRLKEKFWELEKELSIWYDEYVSFFETVLQPDEFQLLREGKDNPAKQVAIPDMLIKYGLAALYAMTIYWTASTILHSKLDLTYAELPPSTPTEAVHLQTPSFDIIKACICIARSSKFFLEPNVSLATTLSISHASACGARVLTAHRTGISEVQDAEMEELGRLMQEARSAGGFAWTAEWKKGMDRMEVKYAFPRPDKTCPQKWMENVF